jgi:8-oxo-dGTP diphosphatase
MSQPSPSDRPRVGVGVLICKDGKVLMGKRLSAHGAGAWSLSGGKLEFGESFFDCAKREAKEETGLELHSLRMGPTTNDFFEKEKMHYVTVFVIAQTDGVPKVMEPHACAEWKWVDWDALPNPLFLPVQHVKKQGFDPFKG